MIARDNTPRWVLVLLIILALPVCQLPFLLDNAPAGVPLVSTLLRIYPFYIITAAYLAYVCYPRRALMVDSNGSHSVVPHSCVAPCLT